MTLFLKQRHGLKRFLPSIHLTCRQLCSQIILASGFEKIFYYDNIQVSIYI